MAASAAAFILKESSTRGTQAEGALDVALSGLGDGLTPVLLRYLQSRLITPLGVIIRGSVGAATVRRVMAAQGFYCVGWPYRRSQVFTVHLCVHQALFLAKLERR